MARLTAQEIETIRKRAELASTGPWEYDASYGNITAPYNDIASDVRYPDAEFIANSREDIPKLLAEVEALNNEIADRERSHIELYCDNKELASEVAHLTGVIGTLRSKLQLIDGRTKGIPNEITKGAIDYANEELR